MAKIVLVSGSNRKGNTEFILSHLQKEISGSKLILLRNQNIQYCKGCLSCHRKESCILSDDMSEIIKALKEADLIIFGVPNYFDNVPGLFKNFIDRLHPLYKSEGLKKKDVIFIYVGGGKVDGTWTSLHQSLEGFVKYLKVSVKKEFVFQALNVGDIENDYLDEIIQYIEGSYANK